ncbi:glycosyltransferase [Catenuloplanes indicus]|uniref:UDP-N-acetylglucosamine transferase subunit ALG13 n=1 Tax=Catenuloplanes indicus TaxID=137267 RepID=A0AAE3W9R1_9ACTN|nr:glycosyltransferase [Catenuloplanes indicus]MDQ0371065.1 UDP-N-acetylglucosamine transferase subunit ALG13 [Catenuloplanes indicus]
MTEASTPSVLVVVGTDVHRFDRLMGWLEQWHTTRRDGLAMLIQHGSSRRPEIPGATAFLAHEALAEAMTRVRAVVSHGGPATITEARRNGHTPIVVARDPAHGEHVDDHQMLFAGRLAGYGLIRLCASATELHTALDEAMSGVPGAPARIPAQTDRSAAVRRVGRIVDDLLAVRHQGRRGGGR